MTLMSTVQGENLLAEQLGREKVESGQVGVSFKKFISERKVEG